MHELDLHCSSICHITQTLGYIYRSYCWFLILVAAVQEADHSGVADEPDAPQWPQGRLGKL